MRPVRHHEVARRLAVIAAQQPDRIRLAPYGSSIEGRTLWRAIISAPQNFEDRADTGQTVATVWLGYGIHGSELSPSDAALRVSEWLVLSDEAAAIRDALVVHVDIMANPDGRERSLSHLESFAGAVVNPDLNAYHNNVPWPKGRGNHYLFDLNRDALFGTQIESRQRIKAIRDAAPDLYLDAHEMAPEDSFLFACPAEPFNPALSPCIHESWDELKGAIGGALDQAGVAHYTGAWNEVFFPGFFDIWPAYHGAVPILLEQATTYGNTVELPNGKQRSFDEAVAAQVCASRAMLEAAAANAETYVSRRKAARSRDYTARYWIVDESGAKRQAIVALLDLHGIDYRCLADSVRAEGLQDHWGAESRSIDLQAGALLISARQPLGALVENMFDFHVPMPAHFLAAERARLENGQKTQIYDCTAWAVSLAFDARVFHTSEEPAGAWVSDAFEADVSPAGDGAFGYAFEDRALSMLPALQALGLTVRLGLGKSDEPFLIRREDQAESALGAYAMLATRTDVRALASSRSDRGLDPGGDRFHLLHPPKLAILAGHGTDAQSVGALWHLFEGHGARATLLDSVMIADYDLDRYDVLIAPHGETFPFESGVYDWQNRGGTLIGIAGATRVLARSGRYGISGRDEGGIAGGLDHSLAAGHAARQFLPETYPIWDNSERAGRDARYLPSGSYLCANVKTHHWLAQGLGDRVPVLFREPAVLQAHDDTVVIRFAEREHLALSGLIWPEAVEMIAGTPCLTRERAGRGQIICFAWDPVFRGYSLGTQRLLLNAVYFARTFAGL